MKIICKVDRKQEVSGFTDFVAVVEITPGNLAEVMVKAGGYSDNKYIEIECNNIRMNQKTLQISCSNAHAAQVLLGVEVCNFVREQYQELANLQFKDGRFTVIKEAA